MCKIKFAVIFLGNIQNVKLFKNCTSFIFYTNNTMDQPCGEGGGPSKYFGLNVRLKA